MPLLMLALPFVLVLAVLLFMPVILLQRYRMGTARRQARGWIATANVFAMALSATFFMAVAAVTTAFVPNAFTYSLIGLLARGTHRCGRRLVEPLGVDAGNPSLHAESLAGARHHARRDDASRVRLLASLAQLACQSGRHVMAGECRCCRLPGSRSRWCSATTWLTGLACGGV